jgi:hypothetical protein
MSTCPTTKDTGALQAQANPSRGVNCDIKSWSSKLEVGHSHNNPTPYTIIVWKLQLEKAMARKWPKEPYEEGIHCNTDSTAK